MVRGRTIGVFARVCLFECEWVGCVCSAVERDCAGCTRGAVMCSRGGLCVRVRGSAACHVRGGCDERCGLSGAGVCVRLAAITGFHCICFFCASRSGAARAGRGCSKIGDGFACRLRVFDAVVVFSRRPGRVESLVQLQLIISALPSSPLAYGDWIAAQFRVGCLGAPTKGFRPGVPFVELGSRARRERIELIDHLPVGAFYNVIGSW